MKVNLKKRYIYAIIGLLILFIGIFVVNAVVDKTTKGWHSATKILIIVDGFTMTLQDAIDNNVFIDGATTNYATSISAPSHSADEIWISVEDGEMNLIQALSSTNKLCPAFPLKTSYFSAPTSLAYHFATEIEVTPDTSLQDAINEGNFCVSSCIPNCTGKEWGNDGCGGICPGISNWILVSGDSSFGTNDFAVMKYEAKKGIDNKPVSQPEATPWTEINFQEAKNACESLGSGYHILTNAEWMTIARNIEHTPESWTDGVVGSGMIKRGNVGLDDVGSYNGANPEYGIDRNTKAELTLSNGETIWDISGNVYEWIDDTCTPGIGQGFWANRNSLSEWNEGDLSDFERAEAGPSTSIDYGASPSDKGTGMYSRCGAEYKLIRSGYWDGSYYKAGIFYLYSYKDSWVSIASGFRCVKSLDCDETACYSYSWNVGDWGICSSGIPQTRTVYCERHNDGASVNDNYCSGTKPPVSRDCWTGTGCSSCPDGWFQWSDQYHRYCNLNGREGRTHARPPWTAWNYNQYSAQCCCSKFTTGGSYNPILWEIIY